MLSWSDESVGIRRAGMIVRTGGCYGVLMNSPVECCVVTARAYSGSVTRGWTSGVLLVLSAHLNGMKNGGVSPRQLLIVQLLSTSFRSGRKPVAGLMLLTVTEEPQ